jgi:replicative DNA helicase
LYLFYDERNQAIFEVLTKFQRDRKVATLALVVGELESKGKMQSAGGPGHIKNLVSVATDDADEFKASVSTVADTALCRRYYEFAGRVQEKSSSTDDPAELSDYILNDLRKVNRLVQDESILYWEDSLKFRYDQTERRLNEQVSGDVVRMDCPWASWNRIVRPMRKGTLALIAGLSGLGKTMIASSLAEYWAQKGFRVCFFHYELDHSLMLDRQDARQSGVSLDRIEDGDLTTDELQALMEARGKISEWPGAIHYIHSPGWTAQRVASTIRKLVDMGECDVFIVDYLQKMPLAFGRSMTSAQMVGYNVDLLKDATEISPGCVGVMLSQYNNKAKVTNSVWDLRDDMLRDGSEPHDKSNLAIFLHGEKLKEDMYRDGGLIVSRGNYSPVISWLVDKQTRGPLGAGELYFDRSSGKITDLAWEES